MTMYRHLNLLIDGKIHDSLRHYSHKREVPISKVVREAITVFLSAKADESKDFSEGKGKNSNGKA